MTTDTDTSGNHVGPDLGKYNWEYQPLGSNHGGYNFRLYNYDREVAIDVYPEGGDPENGYNVVVREVELIESGEPVDGYPLFDLTTDSGWFMEMMSALSTAVSWAEEHQ